MNKTFWHQKWENNEINFHQNKANPLLVRNIEKFSLAKGSRIFIPLCGKTLDIGWLLQNGYHVAGAELVETAIEQLFAELNIKPTIVKIGQLKHYSAKNIDIFVGDIFNVTKEILGSVDFIYDRASFVALPEEVRKNYAFHVQEITEKAPQLLITFSYDQSKISGPPYSISNEEIDLLYRVDGYQIKLLEDLDLEGGLKGKVPAKENVWMVLPD